MRARVRAELTAEILAAAAEELSEVGASALSLRAVARRLGMVPSALYRYFPSRDALLTALIIDAYDELGGVAEQASTAGGTGTLDRWMAVTRAVRAWAAGHPHRWALLYGSPVPGYAAPEATVGPALRINEALAGIVRDARRKPAGAFPPAAELDPVVEPMRAALFPGRPVPVIAAAVAAWAALVGVISLERFGHFRNATTEFGPLFDYLMEAAGRNAGLA